MNPASLRVQIPSLNIWNHVTSASHYRTGCSRENDAAFDPPIGARGLDWGLVPRWSPSRGRTPLSAVRVNLPPQIGTIGLTLSKRPDDACCLPRKIAGQVSFASEER
jgi:hypothetical protein